MNIVGLITEYNPFHNGHLYHLNESKKVTNSDYSIAVMSGNYVQRGCPAYVDKWYRTKMALEAGVDMVIEIPTYYSTSSAELFAFGAISLLNAMGIVTSVCFGSEEGKTELISSIADILIDEPDKFRCDLKKYLSQGLGFADSRTKALYDYICFSKDYSIEKEEFKRFLSSPNNILGVEYVKWLKKLKSPIKPATIKRRVTGYHDLNVDSTIASASGIRDALTKGLSLDEISHTIPETTLKHIKDAFLKGYGPITFDDYSNFVQYSISLLGKLGLKDIMEISEGLENRIYNYSHHNYIVSDLLAALNTKRYTNSRLNRSLLYIMLQITRDKFMYYFSQGGPQYIRVLGFRKESEALFKSLKQCATLPIITNLGRTFKKLPPVAREMLEDEVKFTDIYSLGFKNKSLITKGFEFKQPFIVV